MKTLKLDRAWDSDTWVIMKCFGTLSTGVAWYWLQVTLLTPSPFLPQVCPVLFVVWFWLELCETPHPTAGNPTPIFCLAFLWHTSQEGFGDFLLFKMFCWTISTLSIHGKSLANLVVQAFQCCLLGVECFLKYGSWGEWVWPDPRFVLSLVWPAFQRAHRLFFKESGCWAKFARGIFLPITVSFPSIYDFVKLTRLYLCVLSSSHQDQNQGGETGERWPQGDLAEEEEGCEIGIPKKERPEVPHIVSEEWRWLSLLTAGQPKQRLPHHGPQDGPAVPHHRHPQVGQIQQGAQKDLEETAKPQVPCLRKSLQIIPKQPKHFHPTFEWTCTYEQPEKAPLCLYTAYIIYFYVFFRPTRRVFFCSSLCCLR